jgi:hypothetical protein
MSRYRPETLIENVSGDELKPVAGALSGAIRPTLLDVRETRQRAKI